jgi:lipoprotein-anchoring transpeptidase ErfK/SrfK
MKTTAIKLAMTAALAAMITMQQTAQAVELLQTISLKEATQGQLDPDLPVVVVVNQEEHKTHVLQLQNEQLFDVFAIPNAVGKPSTPTPNCRAKICQKELNPSWKPPRSIDPNQKVVPPFVKTHSNPLGLANIRLNIDHGMIALHGTNDPKKIGQSVSHGCVRHLNKDIIALYKIVHLGTPVYIVQSSDDANIPVTEFQTPNAVAHAKTTEEQPN